MALGMELKLRMGMQLVMTPQLQLAIRLLQMSSQELTEYLQEELERNPLLEQSEGGPDGEGAEGGERLSGERQGLEESSSSSVEADDPEHWERLSEEGRLGQELPVDASWNDVYGDAPSGGGGSYESHGSGEAPPLENTLCRSDSLADHLVWQLGVSARDERERALGLAIIDAIDDNGYLASDLEHLAEITGATVDEVEDALLLVQTFDPPGVGARNLAECLLLQLKNKGMARPPYSELLRHLEDLARRDFRKLGRLLKLDESDLADALAVIQSLNPKPGLAFGSEHAVYVVPDVFVRKLDGQWVVEINPESQPQLRVNRYYQEAAGRSFYSEQDRRFLSENARSAQWLIKSLEQRASTILKVAESIVRFQGDFLERGAEYLRPLILKDVAEDIGVHESTISRVTTSKYMHTHRGIFELKYFFSSSLASQSGDAHSSEAVKFKIRKLVEEESPRRPYSDEQLVQMLGEQGVQVARRTVAKYREALAIPPSSRRKRLVADE